jgi:phosphoribosylaminoimidazolecarboxamide formyltransferase/IMP cyclohydrolase
MKVRRAIISVYEKQGIDAFAAVLQDLGVEILSSGGTAAYLRQNGISVTEISDYTGFPEILSGRVKTLHPRISAGILAIRDDEEHMKQLKEHGIFPIDLVVVNLYPFVEKLEDADLTEQERIELIDIGGPTLIRAAAKNFQYVAAVTDPSQYEPVMEELRASGGSLSLETRKRLAAEAFQKTSFYDSAIAGFLAASEDEVLPRAFSLPLLHAAALRYGENPHQKAGYYRVASFAGLPEIRQLRGIELSYNNYLDADAALQAVGDFDEPTVVIVKHTNPCGIGSGKDLLEAYEKALACDPVSAFGGILAVNRPFEGELAEAVKGRFWEILLAPEFTPEALEVLAKKKRLRILQYVPKKEKGQSFACRRVLNGVLLQEMDRIVWDREKLQVVTRRQPTEKEWKALEFAWKAVKHVKSNAIVFAADDRTLGIGAGQMSRVDSVELAVRKAEKAGLSLAGSVLASDAFFPFRDGVDAAARAGATAIVQPGGSVRDEEVIQAADEHNLAMVFTGIRHFRH